MVLEHFYFNTILPTEYYYASALANTFRVEKELPRTFMQMIMGLYTNNMDILATHTLLIWCSGKIVHMPIAHGTVWHMPKAQGEANRVGSENTMLFTERKKFSMIATESPPHISGTLGEGFWTAFVQKAEQNWNYGGCWLSPILGVSLHLAEVTHTEIKMPKSAIRSWE